MPQGGETINKRTIIRLASEVLLLLSIISVGAYAATTWNGTRSYTLQTEGLTVDRPTTLDYGVVPAGPHAETFTVTNTGNAPLTVNAQATPTGATAAWDKTSALIPAGSTATFTLTLTITASGSCSVNFAKA